MSTIARVLVPICAGIFGTLGAGAATLEAQEKQKSSSTLITAEEIERAGVGNAFEAVQLLRPRWFKPREVLRFPVDNSAPQMSEVRVYIDERDKGGLDFLRTIPAEVIATLRYMSTTEVGARFGPSLGPGIIVTFKR